MKNIIPISAIRTIINIIVIRNIKYKIAKVINIVLG